MYMSYLYNYNYTYVYVLLCGQHILLFTYVRFYEFYELNSSYVTALCVRMYICKYVFTHVLNKNDLHTYVLTVCVRTFICM